MHYQVFMALWLTKAHFFKKIAVFFKLWVKKLAGKHAICTAYKRRPAGIELDGGLGAGEEPDASAEDQRHNHEEVNACVPAASMA